MSRRDLRDRGVHRNWISTRVAREELQVVHPQVLGIPGLEMDLMTRFRAALLQMGPDARLSHTSALELFGVLRDHDHATVHVTVPQRLHAPEGITAHVGRPAEATISCGFPVVSVKDAIVQSASLLVVSELRFPAMQAVHDGLLTATALADLHGVPVRAREVVRMMGEEALAGAESGGEANFFRLLKESDLPTPLLQQTVVTFRGEKRLDAYWPTYGLAAEIDGRDVHAQAEAFEKDRSRRNAIQAERVVVINFAVSQVLGESHLVLEDCEANLLARAADLRLPAPWLLKST